MRRSTWRGVACADARDGTPPHAHRTRAVRNLFLSIPDCPIVRPEAAAPEPYRKGGDGLAGRTLREHPDCAHEHRLRLEGFGCVAGVDEAGRGAWAGPVYAGAVVLPPDPDALSPLLGAVRDSKQLSPGARERAFELVLRHARYAGIGAATSGEIDALGIARATRLAWERALGQLDGPADYLLLDAFRLPESPLPQLPLIRGDARSLSIAAASILAKVARDRAMRAAAEEQPPYRFERNKGYGTREHQAALRAHGPCALHRHSWAPLRALRPPEPVADP